MHSPDVNYNIGAAILKRAEIDPNKPAITFEGKTQSYKELSQRVRSLAQSLKDQGVCIGDRVAFLGLNQPAFIEVLLASHCLGAVFVPLNFRLSGPELEYIINDAQAHTLIVDSDCAAVIASVEQQLCCKRYIQVADASGALASQNEAYETVIEQSAPIPHMVESQQHELAIIMYTSGTTGKPKGAMLSHGNLMWNNIQAAFTFTTQSNDISLVCAPLFHIGGLNVTSLNALMTGASLLIHRSFDPTKALADIAHYGVTTMFSAPAMLLFMSQDPTFSDCDLSSLRMIIVGAAPIAKSLLETYIDQGIEINQGYGLTETSPMVSFLTASYTHEKLGSAGKPGLFSDVKVVDSNGETLPNNEVGEILYKGPNVMRGYWNKAEETEKAIDSAGWFYTGDAGYLDDDNFLFISDRVKDMVISGGENVYPAEVEASLYEHPAVKEVAIIGLPHPKWGEAVTAVIALNEGCSLELDELRTFAEATLAKYKLPLAMHVLDELPRNPAGKVLKYQLREDYASAK